MTGDLHRPAQGGILAWGIVPHAWAEWCASDICPYCPHRQALHRATTAPAYYYRLPLPHEVKDEELPKRLVRYRGEVDLYLVEYLGDRVDMVNCLKCAVDLGTDMVVCYSRTINVGEVVDVPSGGELCQSRR